MPFPKELINGFQDHYPSKKSSKVKFDKETVIADGDRSCHNCINKKLLDISRKGDCYGCSKTPYSFMGYWKHTIAKDCTYYKPTK